MAKGFIVAITTVLILIVMLLYVQNFSAKENSELDKIAQLTAAEKVTHAWSDIKDDINRAIKLLIVKEDNSVSFLDQLPSKDDISKFLSDYGLFIKDHYKTPDLNIKFLDPDGNDMDLGTLPPVITILPQNIQYFYPTQAQNKLHITCPAEQIMSITKIFVTINVSNARLNCRPANPSGSTDCEKFSPNRECTPSTPILQRVYFNLTVSDYEGRYYPFQQTCFDIGDGSNPNQEGSTTNIDVKNITGAYSIKVGVGMLTKVLDIDMHELIAKTNTTLILNTSDFYINYLTQIETTAVDYDTDRIAYASDYAYRTW